MAMTPEQQRVMALAAARARQHQQRYPGAVGTAIDAAGSLATGLTEGLAEIPMAPFTLGNAGSRAFEWVWDKGKEIGKGVLGLPPSTPEEIQATKDAREAVNPLRRQTEKIVGNVRKYEGENLHQAETPVGEYAQTIGKFIPAVAGGPQNMVRFGVLPGIASEAAGDVAHEVAPKYEGAARTGAALLTAGVAGIRTPGAYAERMAGRAGAGVTDQQWAQAEALMRDAQTRGIALTPAEAVQQVTGGSTRLGDVQRIVESTTEGGARMAPAMAARPGQVETAGRQVINNIGPQSADPLYQGVQMQNAAQGVLTNARQANNAVAQPYYDALNPPPVNGAFAGPRVSQADQARLMANPRYAAALAEVRDHPEIGPSFANLPDDSVAMVNEVVKRLDRGVEASRQTAMNPEGDNYLSALRQGARTEADTAAANASPDYQTARDLVRQGHETIVDPLNAGVVGQVARTSEVPAQIDALLPKNPIPGSARESGRAVTDMMGMNAPATRSTVRTGVEQIFNRSTRPDPTGRPDQYGGARFAREMTGERAPNIRSAVTTAAGPAVQNDLDSLVQALAATGWRPRPGSLTAFNAEALKDLSKGGVESIVQALVKPFATAKDAVARARLGRQSDLLAEILLNGPQGLNRLRALSRRRQPPNAIARALIQSGPASAP